MDSEAILRVKKLSETLCCDMNVRTWLAGLAMEGLCAGDDADEKEADFIALQAAECADALLVRLAEVLP